MINKSDEIEYFEVLAEGNFGIVCRMYVAPEKFYARAVVSLNDAILFQHNGLGLAGIDWNDKKAWERRARDLALSFDSDGNWKKREKSQVFLDEIAASTRKHMGLY